MNEDDDIDGLAAEYVLGTLDGNERQLVAARRRTDAPLDRAIKGLGNAPRPARRQHPRYRAACIRLSKHRRQDWGLTGPTDQTDKTPFYSGTGFRCGRVRP
jgi:anti-sigma-K factor RskA